MSALEDWGIGQLGELCSIEIGGTPSRNVPRYWDESKESGNLWSSIKDLSAKTIISTEEQITDEGVRHSNVKLQAKGNVLLSFKLTIGRVAKVGIPLYTNEAIAGIASSQIEHDFLFYGLQQWDLLRGVDQAIKGATLNKKKLKQIEFEYPLRKSEQAKIAEVLSTVDLAIEQTDALIAKQQRIKTGLMQDLLTRGIDEHGNLRSEETHEFKDSPLGRIPVEWESKQIAMIAKLQRGHDITEDELEEGPYPVVSSGGIVGYHKMSTSAGPNVVVGRKGTIGKVHYLPGDFWAHDTSLYVIDFQGNSPRFVYYLFNYLKLERFGTKSGSPSLNRNDVHPIRAGMPPFREQEAIAEMLDAHEQHIDRTLAQRTKLLRHKTALMQDLLTGQKRVTPLLESQDIAA